MSTNCTIIAKTPEGWRGIYCHWDGYDKGGVGETLRKHYLDPERVKQLLDLGALSCLGRSIAPSKPGHTFNKPEDGVTVAYGRDGLEYHDNNPASESRSLDGLIGEFGNYYNYVYEGGKWRTILEKS